MKVIIKKGMRFLLGKNKDILTWKWDNYLWKCLKMTIW
jgi:hypothetical protein